MSYTLNAIYDDETDFSFDDSLVEFANQSGTDVARLLVQNSNPIISTAMMVAEYNTNSNADAALGVRTATLVGSPEVENSFLKLAAGARTYISYPVTDNADSVQQGAMRLVLVPQYTGSPSEVQRFLDLGGTTAAGRTTLEHETGGNLSATLYNDAGTAIVTLSGAFAPTSGTSVEIELDYDFTTGDHRLYVNGVLLDSASAITATRATPPASFRIGSRSTTEVAQAFWVDSVSLFSTAQHTTPYTAIGAPGWYSMDDPLVTHGADMLTTGLTDLSSVVFSIPSGTEVRYILDTDGQGTYWDGAEWIDSDDTLAQSNTTAEINTNVATLDLSIGSRVRVRVLLSTRVFDTPAIESLEVTFGFTPLNVSMPTECLVSGNLKDLLGANIASASIEFRLPETFGHGAPFIGKSESLVTTDSEGLFSVSLVETETIGKILTVFLEYTQGGRRRTVTIPGIIIPDQATANFADLIPVNLPPTVF